MKENPVKMALMYDVYGDILTDKQREFFELYHEQDLSLFEIAEGAGITRQGVRDVISRAEGILKDMESKLGLADRILSIQIEAQTIIKAAETILAVNERRGDNSDIRRSAGAAMKAAENITAVAGGTVGETNSIFK